ncbi:hypothetical protein L195_g064648, partial [Trifolium pratense]
RISMNKEGMVTTSVEDSGDDEDGLHENADFVTQNLD